MIARQHHHIIGKSILTGTHQRDTVHYTSVQHRDVVHVGNGTDKRQTARSTHNINDALLVPLLLKVVRFARLAVGGHHHIAFGATKVCLVVVGKYVFRKLPEQQVEIHDIPFLQQILQPDVIVFFQQVDIAVLGTPALTGHIGKSVAGSGTDADGIGKANATVHKAVEHTASEDAAHAAALQNKTATVVNTYHFLHKCRN